MNRETVHQFCEEIFDTMHDGLLVISPQGTVSMVNRALEKMSGYTAEEILGSPCTLFGCDICDIARSCTGSSWCLLFKEGCLDMKRTLLRRKDGSYLPVLKNAALLKDRAGKVIGAVETLTDLSELDRKDQAIEELHRLLDPARGFHGMVGASPAMQEVFRLVKEAARSEAPVVVRGESGTGKELAARAIHLQGKRKDGPFLQLNCAALNESLLESELFGHARGAFTGAHRARKGRFEAADGGDFFLDEIGDMPLALQAKLLRVLENGRVERVGDLRPIQTDVRIITATNRNLEELVRQGRFRQDLYFRINVVRLDLPPLRERLEDLPLLTEAFVRQLRLKTGKPIAGLASCVMERLRSHHWPGNVRELKNTLEHAFVTAKEGLIQVRHLPPGLRESVSSAGRFSHGESKTVPQHPQGSGLHPEKTALVEALKRTGGNQTQAARLLGVNRNTVLNRMRKYGIELEKSVRWE